MTIYEYRRQTAGEVQLDQGGTAHLFDIPESAIGVTLFEFADRPSAKYLLPAEESDRLDGGDPFMFEPDEGGNAQ